MKHLLIFHPDRVPEVTCNLKYPCRTLEEQATTSTAYPIHAQSVKSLCEMFRSVLAIETAAGLLIIDETVPTAEMRDPIEACIEAMLLLNSNIPVKPHGRPCYYLYLNGLIVLFYLGLTKNNSPKLLVLSALCDRNIEGITPENRKYMPQDSFTLPILRFIEETISGIYISRPLIPNHTIKEQVTIQFTDNKEIVSCSQRLVPVRPPSMNSSRYKTTRSCITTTSADSLTA